MLYTSLKIAHIISATLLLTSMVYCAHRWLLANDHSTMAENTQSLTWLSIIPLALFQLMTGFTLISIQHYQYTELWIIGSVVGFIVVISSWLGFSYLLLSHSTLHRRLQRGLLLLCGITLLGMIFLMANKIIL